MSRGQTLPEVLLAKAMREPDRVFARVTSDGEEHVIAFGELANRAGAYARALADCGVRAGDVVPIACPTSPEYLFTVLGGHLLGAALAPVPPPTVSKAEHVRYHAERLRVAAACVDSRIAVVPRSIAESLAPHLDGTGLQLLPVEGLAAERDAAFAPAPFDPDRTAIVQFSSGSTAEPKGVRIRFRNIDANAPIIAKRARMSAADSMLSFLPLFHDFGLFAGFLFPMLWDVPVWLYQTAEFVRRPSFWLKAMSRTRATMCLAPQFVYKIALHRVRDRDVEGVDLSSWRVSFNGGEPVHAATLREFNQRFEPYGLAPTTILPSYGMAEATLAIAIHPSGPPLVAQEVSRDALVADGVARPAEAGERTLELVSCGPPLDGIELAVLGEDDVEKREREVGEVAIRGESLASEYVLGRDERAPLLRGGWFRTGDLGYVAEGLVYVTGRAKDVIIRGGRNYFPQDIERLIEALDGVRLNGVVAFGVYDDERGEERIVAVVEYDTRDEATLGTLPERARKAVYDALEVTLDEVALRRKGWIPKTTSAKLQRARARRLYLEGAEVPSTMT
jgi:acyl-CoA synthetase (AMP-forming)/AMP-acid ligase II